jgi:hypothetical protein
MLGVEAGHRSLRKAAEAAGPLVELLPSKLALTQVGLDSREGRLGQAR